jgi:hypothetical protein
VDEEEGQQNEDEDDGGIKEAVAAPVGQLAVVM